MFPKYIPKAFPGQINLGKAVTVAPSEEVTEYMNITEALRKPGIKDLSILSMKHFFWHICFMNMIKGSVWTLNHKFRISGPES